jgi:hypothetical protein
MNEDVVWRWLRGFVGVALAAMVVSLFVMSPVREVDIPFGELPIRTLDGAVVDQAWFGGQPGVIHVWLPG